MSEHKSLAEALAAFQGEAPKLHKGNTALVESKRTGGKYSYKYVDLADVVEAIQPLMLKHGLSWSAFPTVANGGPALRYRLRHVTGDVESETMPLMLAAQDAQALGSAITYARRYALCAVLNIVADADDDGAAAKAAQERAQQQAPQQQADKSNGASEPPVTASDIQWLKEAAKGLKVGQIKLAFAACGLPVPDPFGFDAVPKAKAASLLDALAGMERE